MRRNGITYGSEPTAREHMETRHTMILSWTSEEEPRYYMGQYEMWNLC